MKLKYVQNPNAKRARHAGETSRIAEQLTKIEKQYKRITPDIVVTAASDPKHALHKYFTWNDSEAGKKYRLWEARQLIACVYIVPTNDKESQPVRAFVNVHEVIQAEESDSESPSQRYVSMRQAMARPDYRSQVIAYAEGQLLGWRNRFGNIQKFVKIAKTIDEELG